MADKILRPARLGGKTALVAGAGQTRGEAIGNGRATAVLFAREGARVLCVDRDLASAEETAAMIAAEGGEAYAFAANITREADCAAMVAEAKARLGRIDILHNNVGIAEGDAPLHLLEEATWDRIMAANLKGMWLTLKHTVPEMREQRGGAIVNISSLTAITPSYLTVYSLAKAAVNKLTTDTAATNARYLIRCNAIMPGLMDSPMIFPGAGPAPGEARSLRDARVPLGGRMGDAWDVARAAPFLASDEARFITGALLPVDGGASVRIG